MRSRVFILLYFAEIGIFVLWLTEQRAEISKKERRCDEEDDVRYVRPLVISEKVRAEDGFHLRIVTRKEV